MSELKYKVGDEVLIKGVITDVNDTSSHPYTIVTDVNDISECIIGKVEDFVTKGPDGTEIVYEQGMNDIWAAALAIADDLSRSTLADMYDGYCTLYDILINFSAKDAFARYTARKKAKNEEYKLQVDAQRSTVEDLKKQYEHELGVLNAMLEELEK